MAQNYGPNTIIDGLVLSLDAADVNSYPGPTSVDVMVVGGGGGGGMDMGGGGGGGGVVYQQNVSVTPGTGVPVVVGQGGWGAPAGGGAYRGDGVGPQPSFHQFTVGATAGGNSSFGSITALGGGFGASSYFQYTPNYGTGGSGGSGGGASGYSDGNTGRGGAGTPGQGYNGGGSGGPYYSGGGGGAGGPGIGGTSRPDGGPGIRIPEMSPFYFGGGGGGASYSLSTGGNGGIGGGGGGAVGVTTGGAGIEVYGIANNGLPGGGGSPNSQTNTPGGNAGANTGGGGGGGSHYNAFNQGGDGGSGIVIVRYKGPLSSYSGDIIQSRNGYTYHTFLSSGTFMPGGANQWYDVSGNGWIGNLVNGPTFTSANRGGIVLDGTDDAIRISSVLLSGADSFTVNQWIQTSAGETGGTTFGNYPAGNLQIFYGSTYMGMWLANSSTYVASPVPFFSTPVMITAVRSGTNTYFYQNGVLLKTGSSSSSIGSTSDFRIGENTIASEEYTGTIFTTQVYNRALTTAEIQQIYNSQKSRFGL